MREAVFIKEVWTADDGKEERVFLAKRKREEKVSNAMPVSDEDEVQLYSYRKEVYPDDPSIPLTDIWTGTWFFLTLVPPCPVMQVGCNSWESYLPLIKTYILGRLHSNYLFIFSACMSHR